MHHVSISPTFDAWRSASRGLLIAGVKPADVFWSDASRLDDLFPVSKGTPESETPPAGLTIPSSFLHLAKVISCHRNSERWSLLYHAAYRIAVGRERMLLKLETDPLIRQLNKLSKDVRRDHHKMKAFVRFRKTGECAATGREQFVAWFEPQHHIVDLSAPFFSKRFASFDWSILTPDRCAHFVDGVLSFSEGVDASQAPQDDELEDYWRTYYSNIFNPARMKLKAMQSEMPKKYWKNLPEASLIESLSRSSSTRVAKMVDQGPNRSRAHVSARIPKGAAHPDSDRELLQPIDALAQVGALTLPELKEASDRCRSCPLYKDSTRTVFGEGNTNAEIMIIGEQPGDREDLAGRPFVGPAGELLDRALVEAGLRREECYLTNTVKHFKWKPDEFGKRRLHNKASKDEIETCKPWVLAEILKVKPKTIILLGSTAAQALVDPQFRITKDRGLVNGPLAERMIATVHPSYLLRISPAQKESEFAAFVDDLRLAIR